MTIDLVDGAVGQRSSAFIRFDIPSEVQGWTVSSATLFLTVADGAQSGSPSTGILWLTAPFDLRSLASSQPALLEPAVGIDQGAVSQGDIVVWPIPVDSIVAGSALHLAVVPVIDEGVDYWNADGDVPPRLDLVLSEPLE